MPLANLAKGMYLCKIKSADQITVFRFMINETGSQRSTAIKMGNTGRSGGMYLSKNKAAQAVIDSLIVSKPGYYPATVLWTEKDIDSVTIFLQDTGSTLPGALVRTIIPFDMNWLFYKGDASGADKAAFADGSWRALNVPHDWSIEGPYDQNATTSGYGGYLPAGIGWYRKHFTLPATLQGRRIFIEFDGVMANSTVYINGTTLGTRPSGYMTFRYEITGQANFGAMENVVAVKADNSIQPASRWYTGAGIYRHVRIIAVNPVHIDKWATFVTTPATSAVHIQTTVVNQGTSAQNVTVQATLIDPSGTKLAPVTSTAQNVAAAGSATFAVDVPVANPLLWSLESPNMYQVAIAVQSGGTVLDDEVTPFGIRTIKFDPETGFFLNGKSVKHKGVALHHDLSGLGAAVPQRAMQRRLAILKTLGVNAIRTSHNPVAPEVLDLYDRMGFLVLDEFFDVWTGHKYSMPGDYAAYFNKTDPATNNKWYQTDLADIVKRDRNHPSVVFYSIGNEIRDNITTRVPITKDMVSICHTNDPTRPVTQALFQPSSAQDYPGGTLNILDVFGVNYRTAELLEAITQTSPHHAGVSTEMGMNPGEWSSFYMKNLQIVGEYLWTGADYLGESPNRWPVVGGGKDVLGSGLTDRMGAIKDMGYQYQAIWSANPVVRPKTSNGPAVKVLLTVDHSTITTDLNDVAYVKASIVDATGLLVATASSPVTFALTGAAGVIKAVDSGTNIGESYIGPSRNAWNGVCYAIVQMKTAGSVTVTASSGSLTGSSVTVTGINGPFVPCSGNCD
jgi:beta-galactosidase